MAYYPKNKIQTGLYVEGDNSPVIYKTIDNKIYTGYYYKLSNGKTFSGKTPNDPTSVEIYAVGSTGGTTIVQELNSPPQVIGIPDSSFFPTEKDYKIGEFTRYFSIKRNQDFIKEITKETFDNFKKRDTTAPWMLYRTFFLPWLLTGDIYHVAKVNKNIVELHQRRDNVPTLSIFLKRNWIQYYKFEEKFNLFTDGITPPVLITRNKEIYRGDYFIDTVKGPRIGPYPNDKNTNEKLYYKDITLTMNNIKS